MMSVEQIMQSFHVIPVVVVGAYIIAEILKKVWLKTDEKRAMLPVICGIIGAVCGVGLFYAYPAALDTATNSAIGAIADGAFSGVMATGCNQIYKQVKKFFNTTSTTNTES